jgi:hypothetical protein
MRLLLFVLGVFTTVGYIEKPAEAEQKPPPGASINLTNPRSVGTQHSNNAWPIDLARVRLVHLIPTRRHRKHVHQISLRGAKRLRLAQKAPASFDLAAPRESVMEFATM